MNRTLTISILLSTAALAQPALADSVAGKKLVDANCTKCHDSQVFSRQDHKITSLAALDKQVVGCTKGAHAGLSEADQKDIAQYLNEQYYKFK